MIIIGAGNLGKHIIDQLKQDGFQQEIFFFDENIAVNKIYNNYQVISDWNEFYKTLGETDNSYFIALGNPRMRKKIFSRINTGNLVSLISSHVGIVSEYVEIGKGSMIQPSCCISHNVKTGLSCLIHAATLVGHDVTIGDFVSIGSNVNILKGVQIGNFSVIGPNVLVYPNIKIGNNVYIEPGVIVKNDVADYATLSL